jgi:hypothetical protein
MKRPLAAKQSIRTKLSKNGPEQFGRRFAQKTCREERQTDNELYKYAASRCKKAFGEGILVEVFYCAQYESGFISKIDVGSGVHCLRSFTFSLHCQPLQKKAVTSAETSHAVK